MSEHYEDNYDVVGHHNAKFLAPKSDLHPSAGNLVKQEQIYLTTLHILGEFSKRADARIKRLSDPTIEDKGETMDEIISDVILNFARRYNSYSGGVKALRSQQITKREASQGAGASLPVSEPKRSLWDKITGKNKPVAESV